MGAVAPGVTVVLAEGKMVLAILAAAVLVDMVARQVAVVSQAMRAVAHILVALTTSIV